MFDEGSLDVVGTPEEIDATWPPASSFASPCHTGEVIYILRVYLCVFYFECRRACVHVLFAQVYISSLDVSQSTLEMFDKYVLLIFSSTLQLN